MNSTVFVELFTEMLQLLEEDCIIIMDKLSYHSVLTKKVPSSNLKKCEIISWFSSRNMNLNLNYTVAELLNIVKAHEHKYKIYILDQRVANMGHEFVQSLPYHCQYDPDAVSYTHLLVVGRTE